MRNKIVKNLNNNWTFKRDSESDWLKAEVPGCVHTDLLNNKKINDPFVGLNEAELQWIANENWIYKRSFTPDADIFEMEFIILRFQGLDTYASVFLNDNEVLKIYSPTFVILFFMIITLMYWSYRQKNEETIKK